MNLEGHNEIDKVGISLSGLCAIHCILTPILLIFMPNLGEYFEHELVHMAFFFLVAPVAFFSFYRVYKVHRDKIPFILGTIGSGLLIVTLVEHGHSHSLHLLSIVGSILLVAGHFISLRKCRCVGHSH